MNTQCRAVQHCHELNEQIDDALAELAKQADAIGVLRRAIITHRDQLDWLATQVEALRLTPPEAPTAAWWSVPVSPTTSPDPYCGRCERDRGGCRCASGPWVGRA